MLNIITACIRPQNLKVLHQSFKTALQECGHEVPITWHIVLDERKANEHHFLAKAVETKQLDFDSEIPINLMINDTFKTSWDSPVNYVLKRITSGLVCLVDDDNIMHPDFLKCIYPAYLQGSKGFLFHQLLGVDKSNNKHVRFAKPSRIKPACVDSAQFCFDRSIIENVEWSPKINIPDGVFISDVWQKHSNLIKIIDEILCYYNYLKPRGRSGLRF